MTESSDVADSQLFTSQRPAVGTYDEALAHVGRKGTRLVAPFPLSEVSVKMFCAMIQDANQSYWNDDVSTAVWGGKVVPPPLAASSVPEMPWTPTGPDSMAFATFAVPLPGDTLINVRSVSEHHRPFYVGESLEYYDEIADVSPERSTRLGVGHFLTTILHYEDAEQNPVVTITNTMFRFTNPAGEA